jgi:hypothetical protein
MRSSSGQSCSGVRGWPAKGVAAGQGYPVDATGLQPIFTRPCERPQRGDSLPAATPGVWQGVWQGVGEVDSSAQMWNRLRRWDPSALPLACDLLACDLLAYSHGGMAQPAALESQAGAGVAARTPAGWGTWRRPYPCSRCGYGPCGFCRSASSYGDPSQHNRSTRSRSGSSAATWSAEGRTWLSICACSGSGQRSCDGVNDRTDMKKGVLALQPAEKDVGPLATA